MGPVIQIRLYGPRWKKANAQPKTYSGSTHGPCLDSGANIWSPTESSICKIQGYIFLQDPVWAPQIGQDMSSSPSNQS